MTEVISRLVKCSHFCFVQANQDAKKIKNFRDLDKLIFSSGPAVRMVNLITLYRIITFPLLIVLVFSNCPDVFKWLLLASFFTDMIDGYLARKYKAMSILGARLDSIGDDLTVLAALTGLFHYRTEFLKEQLPLISLLLGLFAIQLAYSLFRYKKFSSFHTYGAKLAALLQGLFLLSVFFFQDIFYPLFYSAVIVTAIELAEEIILVYFIPEWKNDVKGLYWVLRKKSRESL